MVLAIICLFFGIVEEGKTMLIFILSMPFSYRFKPRFRQESMFLVFLINLGKWAFRMLLTEPARPLGDPVLEIQGLFAAILFGTETIVA